MQPSELDQHACPLLLGEREEALLALDIGNGHWLGPGVNAQKCVLGQTPPVCTLLVNGASAHSHLPGKGRHT